MTDKSKKSNSYSKVKDFELDEKFQEKYSDFTRIYTVDKNLVLEHFKAGLIISKYYPDDIIRTTNALKNTFMEESGIEIQFVHDTADQFLKDLGRLLGRRLLEDVREQEQEEQKQEAQAVAEQQQRNSILEEIKQLRQQHQDITVEEWSRTLQEKFKNVKDVVKDAMPEIWPGLEFVVSINRILNIHGNTLPFIGIILGRPSSYKTVIIELLRDWPNTFYTDNFTARSFVSHSTSVDPEKLEQIDMLPRMKDNTFLTPELSPMFTTKDEELTQTLGIITRIADGHGYSSDSGAHGHRGYDEDIMFAWAAAAVDIPYKVFKILNTLGHRLYFYRSEFPEESLDELLEYATTEEKNDFNDKKARVQSALFDYLKWFEICPYLYEDHSNGTRKIKWDYAKNDRAAIKIIAGMADVLSYLRCIAKVWETKDSQGSEYAYSISPREVPRRAIKALSNLARGHALMNGRNYITMDDIQIVVKTATDSAQVERVSMFSLLLAHGGKLTTTQILESLRVSRPTALRTMAEFHAIGLVEMDEFHEPAQNNMTKRIALSPKLDWLLTDPVIKKFFPHTTSFSSESKNEPEPEPEPEPEDIASVFWSIYERLENGNGNGKAGTVGHKELHEALVSSGKFYAGDATQIVEDMVKAGRLEAISFETYRRTSERL